MKQIQMEFTRLPEDKQIGIVKLSGEVDIANASKFANFIDKMRQAPCTKLLFNLEHLRYMNSTGFGILASFAMQEKDQGDREIIFCNMQRMILNTFSLFGLLNIWPNFPSVEEALAAQSEEAYAADDHIDANNGAVDQEENSSPQKMQSTQNDVPEAQETSATSLSLSTTQQRPAEPKTTDDTDDQLVEAPAASTPQVAPPGEAHVDVIEINLPSEMFYLSQIRDFIFSFFIESFSEEERENMTRAVDEACSNAIEHAHKFDRTKRMYLTLEIVKNQKVALTIKDSGEDTFKNIVQSDNINQDKLKQTGRGMGLFLIKQIMDEVHIKPTDSWGTSITMVKHTTNA